MATARIVLVALLCLPILLVPEQGLFEVLNVMRGENTLQLDGRLVDLARQRSEDMAMRGYFSHVTPEGKMVFDMLDELKIPSPYAGEVLVRTAQFSIESIIEAFMASPSHRHCLLNAHYTDVGIGWAEDTQGREYITIVLIGGQ